LMCVVVVEVAARSHRVEWVVVLVAAVCGWVGV
jgi:hypothetical protein